MSHSQSVSIEETDMSDDREKNRKAGREAGRSSGFLVCYTTRHNRDNDLNHFKNDHDYYYHYLNYTGRLRGRILLEGKILM